MCGIWFHQISCSFEKGGPKRLLRSLGVQRWCGSTNLACMRYSSRKNAFFCREFDVCLDPVLRKSSNHGPSNELRLEIGGYGNEARPRKEDLFVPLPTGHFPLRFLRMVAFPTTSFCPTDLFLSVCSSAQERPHPGPTEPCLCLGPAGGCGAFAPGAREARRGAGGGKVTGVGVLVFGRRECQRA